MRTRNQTQRTQVREPMALVLWNAEPKYQLRISAASSTRPRHRDVAALAYQLWLDRGRPHGQDQDDWLRAEKRLTERPKA